MNYRIHTDAVKENLIPPELTPEQIAYTYASEADLLSEALVSEEVWEQAQVKVAAQAKKYEKVNRDKKRYIFLN